MLFQTFNFFIGTQNKMMKNVFAFAIKVSGVQNTIVRTKNPGIFQNIFYILQKKGHTGF